MEDSEESEKILRSSSCSSDCSLNSEATSSSVLSSEDYDFSADSSLSVSNSSSNSSAHSSVHSGSDSEESVEVEIDNQLLSALYSKLEMRDGIRESGEEASGSEEPLNSDVQLEVPSDFKSRIAEAVIEEVVSEMFQEKPKKEEDGDKEENQVSFDPFDIRSFFFEKIERDEAEELLRVEPVGTFLLRPSASKFGNLVLSVRMASKEKNPIRHYLIEQIEDYEKKQFYSMNDSNFPNVAAILLQFCDFELGTGEQATVLRKPLRLSPIRHMTARLTFEGEEREDLSFVVGEPLSILGRGKDEWLLARNSMNSVGFVPCTHLEAKCSHEEDKPEELTFEFADLSLNNESELEIEETADSACSSPQFEDEDAEESEEEEEAMSGFFVSESSSEADELDVLATEDQFDIEAEIQNWERKGDSEDSEDESEQSDGEDLFNEQEMEHIQLTDGDEEEEEDETISWLSWSEERIEAIFDEECRRRYGAEITREEIYEKLDRMRFRPPADLQTPPMPKYRAPRDPDEYYPSYWWRLFDEDRRSEASSSSGSRSDSRDGSGRTSADSDGPYLEDWIYDFLAAQDEADGIELGEDAALVFGHEWGE